MSPRGPTLATLTAEALTEPGLAAASALRSHETADPRVRVPRTMVYGPGMAQPRTLVVIACLLSIGCDDPPAAPPPPSAAEAPASATAEGAAASVGEGPGAAATAGVDTAPAREHAASTLVPTPFAVGQWTTHHFLAADGSVETEMTYKIVGEQDGAWWFEVELSGTSDVGVRLLLGIGDRFDPDSADIREAVVRMPGGRLQRFGGATMAAVRSQYAHLVRALTVRWTEDLEREDIVVPAGRFLGCLERDNGELRFGRYDGRGTTWNHSAVPISAMVRMHGDDGTRIVLADFGLTGAEATMDGPAEELNVNVPAGLLRRLMKASERAGRRGGSAPATGDDKDE